MVKQVRSLGLELPAAWMLVALLAILGLLWRAYTDFGEIGRGIYIEAWGIPRTTREGGMSDKPLAKMTLSELIEAMRNRGPDDIRYRPFQAELERRMAISQIRSSQYQLAAVIAMFITAAIAAYSIG